MCRRYKQKRFHLSKKNCNLYLSSEIQAKNTTKLPKYWILQVDSLRAIYIYIYDASSYVFEWSIIGLEITPNIRRGRKIKIEYA